ncbi:hypothetical protein OOZ15_07590 [Galbibacter sp. EGI 63066]|uniref:hypothetical protein n=1 Tax=Galbibacter sp. EGI 63066 TaxID=2993559 RepID=UPI002249173A|nr:hypothetical protein [Galbibacter sp. EGI 63066]MCX2679795.1 hypothetical protein [Galbibacter sp. EGI 63066]
MKTSTPYSKQRFVLGLILFFTTMTSSQISKNYGQRLDNTQYATSAAEAALSEMFVQGLGKTSETLELENINGSPYLNESFTKGKVFYKDSLMGEHFLRYNAYSDEVELKRTVLKEESIKALLKDKYIYCTISGVPVVYTSYSNDKEQMLNGYLLKITEGSQYSLYVKKTKIFKEGKISTNSLAQSIPPKFVDETEYYIGKHHDNIKIHLPVKKRKLLQVFNIALRPKIKKYIKQHKIKLKDKNELVKLIAHVNTLHL